MILHPDTPVQRPIPHRLGDVLRLDLVGAFEIGDGAGDAENLVVSPGRQTKLFHGGLEDAHGLGLERAELADLAWGHPAVDGGTVGMGAEPLGLTAARFEHLGAEVGGGWPWAPNRWVWRRRASSRWAGNSWEGGPGGHIGELGERDGGDLDVQVDT